MGCQIFADTTVVLHISTGELLVVLRKGMLAAQNHRVCRQCVVDRLCMLQGTGGQNRPGNSTTCLQMLGWTAQSPPSKQTRLRACLRYDLAEDVCNPFSCLELQITPTDTLVSLYRLVLRLLVRLELC